MKHIKKIMLKLIHNPFFVAAYVLIVAPLSVEVTHANLMELIARPTFASALFTAILMTALFFIIKYVLQIVIDHIVYDKLIDIAMTLDEKEGVVFNKTGIHIAKLSENKEE